MTGKSTAPVYAAERERKNKTDSEGALRAFAVVHARGSEMYREAYVFVDFYT